MGLFKFESVCDALVGVENLEIVISDTFIVVPFSWTVLIVANESWDSSGYFGIVILVCCPYY